MGSRLANLAIQALIAASVLAAPVAFADDVRDPVKARDLTKQGLDQYRAKQYEQAAVTLKQAYELDPKPDSLFSWAQAERLAGHCEQAIPLYRQLTDETSDLGTAKLVHDNLARCEQALKPTPPEAKPEPEPVPAPTPPPPQTIIREVRYVDRITTGLFIGGAFGFGIGGGLFVASVGSANDADHARTYDDHVAFADRASTERTLAYVAAGAGAAMIGVAIYRMMTGAESPPETTVSATVGDGAAAVSMSGRW